MSENYFQIHFIEIDDLFYFNVSSFKMSMIHMCTNNSSIFFSSTCLSRPKAKQSNAPQCRAVSVGEHFTIRSKASMFDFY